MVIKVLIICVLAHHLANAEWKPLNSQNSPDADGLVVGLNAAGNKIFAGRATLEGQRAVGKLITTASPGFAAGLTLEYGHAEHFFTDRIEYYATEDTCNYEWVPSKSDEVVPNAVQHFIPDGSTMYVGRIFTLNEMQVGKVVVPYGIYYAHRGQFFINQPTYEVLTCTRRTAPQPPVSPKPCLTEGIEDLKNEIKIHMKSIATLNKLLAIQETELAEKTREVLSKLAEISKLQDKLSKFEAQNLF